jgi:hypothetical protein
LFVVSLLYSLFVFPCHILYSVPSLWRLGMTSAWVHAAALRTTWSHPGIR